MGEIVNRREIQDIISRLKADGLKIVFTNGCFDIIHAGHVRYLRDARKYGDILIVGLNSDRSVGSLKHGRPIVPEGERAEVIAALDMVDYAVVFDEETPYELIKAIKPDVIVKGGDWDVGDIVGADLVREVYSLPYHKGISTTDIVRKIKSL
ncbi:MAG TPA: D-glycero-beta-D-manno-heptose 1-phosphate adenylyltransferase [Nitrospirae bacterium]|nr:D-glycero-beta-D-manno-heptose 1-phosphate adenylyltransferase [Nitrospirota bacterium]HDZ89008.1 D-glycero-beta-D-manno-heptose 1-phosphate adenylyltransferase [Nitrospirota bacterium]